VPTDGEVIPEGELPIENALVVDMALPFGLGHMAAHKVQKRPPDSRQVVTLPFSEELGGTICGQKDRQS